MKVPPEVLLSCWMIEAARSSVLDGRGYQEPAVRAAERARILARECAAHGSRIRPDLAGRHAGWMGEVAGTTEETGAMGWFFLQRIGAYVDAHTNGIIPQEDHERLVRLGAVDAGEVEQALSEGGLPPPPPPEWPATPEAHPPGRTATRFGVMGDPHVGVEIAERMIPAAVADLNREEVAFSVALGDLTQNGRPELFVRARELLEELEAPYLVTLGNHDMWGSADGEAGLDHFASAFGRLPYGIHEQDGVRVVVVNTADPAASPYPPFDLVSGSFTDDPNEAVPGGRIAEDVAEWMAGIEPGPPTFIILHHPPYPYTGFPPLVFGLDEGSTRHLAALAGRTGAWGIICGHTHRSAISDLAGTPVIEVPSVKEWPFGYGVVEVADEGWAFNLRPVTDEALVTEASARASLLFRRYARGPDEARGFSGAAQSSSGI